MNSTTAQTFKWYQNPLHKTLFWGFIWAFFFALLLPIEKIQLWYYSFLIGSVPSTLLWDWFNLQNATSTVIVALVNALIIMTPFWFYRKTQQQIRWLYVSISLYAFINAALGFTIIISMKNLAHL